MKLNRRTVTGCDIFDNPHTLNIRFGAIGAGAALRVKGLESLILYSKVDHGQ
jgi:hypothetical protein